ncbi:hypothetical protein A2U01_0092854, partial [Trifolium medium]|nr:hypothetical protein [Trifolium medium]
MDSLQSIPAVKLTAGESQLFWAELKRSDTRTPSRTCSRTTVVGTSEDTLDD